MQAEVTKTTLKTKLLGMAAVVSALLSIGLAADAQGQAAIVIQGGTLVDGNGGAPMANSVIVIQGNRITAIGRAGAVQIPAGARVIDGAGKFITPGLIDAMAGGYWMYGEGYLHYGVTSVVVNGARGEEGLAMRDAVNHGIIMGPRMFQTTVDARGKDLKSADDARAKARAAIAMGADVIGTDDGDAPPEFFAAYADEAHKAGKGVMMRCVGPATRGKECVLAGADTMLHTGEIGVQINKDPEKWKDYIGLPPDPYCDMDPAKEKEMIAFLVAHNSAPIPNFMAADRGFASSWHRVQAEDRELFSDPNLRAYYPNFAIQDLYDNIQSPEEFLTPDQISNRSCGFKNHAKFTGDLIAAGGHALVSMDDTQSAPGLGVQQDMAVFQEDAHVPPMKIIQAATKWAADAYHLKDLGTIEVGKLADLVVVTADPTKDILNMRKISNVIKDGQEQDISQYHPWYNGWIFADNRYDYDIAVVSDLPWASALKGLQARGQGGPGKPLLTTVAPNGNQVGILPGVADIRKGPGAGPVPNYTLSPTPGILTIAPHTVMQNSGDATITLTGLNFVKRSVVYVNDGPVPTFPDSGTKLHFTVPANLLASGGKLHVTVHNPEPLATAGWGGTSNTAHILVPFSFSTELAHPANVETAQD